jgi:hypothetical protein
MKQDIYRVPLLGLGPLGISNNSSSSRLPGSHPLHMIARPCHSRRSLCNRGQSNYTSLGPAWSSLKASQQENAVGLNYQYQSKPFSTYTLNSAFQGLLQDSVNAPSLHTTSWGFQELLQLQIQQQC